jgi:hypothetical protein
MSLDVWQIGRRRIERKGALRQRDLDHPYAFTVAHRSIALSP